MAIISNIRTADANGVILEAGAECVGFCLLPGAPSRLEPSNLLLKVFPGSYPVTLRPRAGGYNIEVDAPHAFYFENPIRRGFDLVDCDVGDSWRIFTFETRSDGIIPGPKQRVPVRVQDAVAVPTAAPTLATDGFKLRPSVKRITSYFSGTAQVNTLWVRQLNGTWFNTLDTVDMTAANALGYDTRELIVPGDRYIWVAGGAGQVVTIEAEMEVG